MLSTARRHRRPEGVTLSPVSGTRGGSAAIGHSQQVTAVRESLASGPLVLAWARARLGGMAGYGLAPACQWAITRFGWRAALAGHAAIGLLGVGVAALATFCVIARE